MISDPLLFLGEMGVPVSGGHRTLRLIREVVDPRTGVALHQFREGASGDLTADLLRESDLTADVPLIQRRSHEDVAFGDWARGGDVAADSAPSECDEEIDEEAGGKAEFCQMLEATHVAVGALLKALGRPLHTAGH